MIISFLFSLVDYYIGPIWDPSGQPAYGLTHMGPMLNRLHSPYGSHMGSPYWTHIGMFAGEGGREGGRAREQEFDIHDNTRPVTYII